MQINFTRSVGTNFIKKKDLALLSPFPGDPLGIRTPDPLLKRQLLCQLS